MGGGLAVAAILTSDHPWTCWLKPKSPSYGVLILPAHPHRFSVGRHFPKEVLVSVTHRRNSHTLAHTRQALIPPLTIRSPRVVPDDPLLGTTVYV